MLRHPLARVFALTAVVTVAVLLTGCFGSTTQVRVTSEYTQQIKTVGVVSLLHPWPHVSHLKSSAMESEFGDAALAGWNAEALVRQTIVPRLQRKGFTVTMLVPDGALAAARDSDWRAPEAASIAEAAYAAGAAAGFDTLVVVQAEVSADFVTDTNQKIRGYGIQRAFDSEPFVYAALFVEAYDIKRRFVVGRAEGRVVEPAVAGAWIAPYDSIDGRLEVDGAAATALGEQIARVLANTVGAGLQEVGL
ncbi:MAG: hypothetical protein AB7Q81_18080 [Gammaproteobacteria bacterium]